MAPLQVPIVIGVADIKNGSKKVEDAREPAQLMYEAILAAIKDTDASDPTELQSSIDSIDVVKTWTWPYPDCPGLLAEKLKVKPKHKHYSEHGGNQPGKLFDDAARRISNGEVKVAVVTGGEALASREFSYRSSQWMLETLYKRENADHIQYLPVRLRTSCHPQDGPNPPKP